jgi:large subunit ribosomal protein L35
MKTHKGLKGRIKITKNGKILRRRVGKSHLMSTKSGKRVRQMRGWREMSSGDRKAIKRQYGVG